MDFEGQLDLFAYWLRNDKCISSREVSGLNQGYQVQAGENKGAKKSGTDGAYLSAHLKYINRIYLTLTVKQRAVFDIEYGVANDQPCHNQLERADHLGLSIMAYKKRLRNCRITFRDQLSK